MIALSFNSWVETWLRELRPTNDEDLNPEWPDTESCDTEPLPPYQAKICFLHYPVWDAWESQKTQKTLSLSHSSTEGETSKLCVFLWGQKSAGPCLRQDISDVHPYLCQTTWLSSFQVFSCLHSHLAVGTLRLQTCTTAPSFPWVLGTQNTPRAIFPALFLLPVHTPPPAQSRAFHNS